MRESGVFAEDKNFLDTSPSNGLISEVPYEKRWGFVIGNQFFSPADQNFGDSHFYYLENDCEKQETFPLFRFLSESGFQSEPSFQDYNEVSIQQDWS